MNQCPICHRPMRELKQPRWPEDLPPYLLEDCQTEGCALYMVTLTAGLHARLTTTQVLSYATARQSRRESCPTCDGNGDLGMTTAGDEAHEITCPTCKGTGVLTTENERGNDLEIDWE